MESENRMRGENGRKEGGKQSDKERAMEGEREMWGEEEGAEDDDPS